MEKYFTNSYNQVKEIRGAQINLDTHGRWICYCNVEKAGSEYEEITLYDNYCERYTLRFNVPNKIFTDFDGRGYTSQDIITLKTKTINQHALPDYCIDVMQTFSCPIAFEVLRRQAEIIAKNYMSRPMENKLGLAMCYPLGL